MANNLVGDHGNNFLFGSNDVDHIDGKGGDDFLIGGDGNDHLTGGKGKDQLDGGRGSDTFHFQRGDGQDTIFGYDDFPGKADTILFGDAIAPADVQLAREGDHLLLSLRGSADQLSVHGFFQPWQSREGVPLRPIGVEQLRFADGTTWDRVAILTQVQLARAPMDVLGAGDDMRGGVNLDGGAGNDELVGGMDSLLIGGSGDDRLHAGGILLGGSGNDLLSGIFSNDILQGGSGDDVLNGYGGQDTILFGRGDGQDRLDIHSTWGGNANAIVMRDVLTGAVQVSRSGDDLLIAIKGSSDQVTVTSFFGPQGATISDTLSLAFADGSAWSGNQLRNAAMMPVLAPIEGGSGDDTLIGGWDNDTLIGRDGHDVLDGGAGHDVLIGGNGVDVLIGGDGDDTLVPGAGDAILDAGHGHNMVILGRDAGVVRLQPPPGMEASTTIEFEAGIAPADLITLARTSYDLTLGLQGGTLSLTIPLFVIWDGSVVSGGISLHFASGETWDAAALLRMRNTGDNGDNAMWGEDGQDDVLYGLGGRDEMHGRSGNDALHGGSGIDLLFGDQGSDLLRGGEGEDLLAGGDGNDTLDGGAGDDRIEGLAGNDTILFGRQAGNDLVFGLMQQMSGTTTVRFDDDVQASELAIAVVDSRLQVSILGSPASLAFDILDRDDPGAAAGYLQFQFGDGSVWDSAAIARALMTGDDNANHIKGTAGNDTLRGQGGDDWLEGRAGDDQIFGGDGVDTLFGGEGNDTMEGGRGNDGFDGGAGDNSYRYNAGDGWDTIQAVDWGTAGHNSIVFGTGIRPQDVTLALELTTFNPSLKVNFADGAGGIVVQAFTPSQSGSGLPHAIESMQFADGTSWDLAAILRQTLIGGSGDDMLGGDAQDNLIDGRGGRDHLRGEGGNDTLIGGTGDDQLHGGEGSDLYLISRGDGLDNIDDQPDMPGNVVRFGAGILPGDVRIEAVYNGMIVDYGMGDQIRILGGVNPYGVISRFEFSNGQSFTAAELDNHAPTLKWAALDLTLKEGYNFSMRPPEFIDADAGDSLSLSFSMADGSALPSWMGYDAASNWFTGSAGYASSGVYAIRATATDRGGLSVASTFTVTVTDVDRAPVLQHAPAAADATEAAPFSITFAADTFTDPDSGVPLSYTLTAGGQPLPSFLHFDSATRTLSGSAADADTGVLNLELRATEPGGLSASTGFTLRIANINQAPVPGQAIPAQSVDDGAAFSYVLPANTFTDADAGDSASIVALGLPYWLSFNSATRSFSGTPSYADLGTVAIDVRATDRAGLSATATLQLTVAPAASVTVNGTAAADVLSGKSNHDSLFGLDGNDQLFGMLGNDALNGGNGNDLLDGGMGADSMSGGSGDDHYLVGQAGDVVIEAAGGGTDKVSASVSYALTANVENLVLTGFADLNGTGNTLANSISGNSGANLLNGGAGADIHTGLGGNDTYLFDTAGDSAVEMAGGGFDQVISSVGLTLGANLEALTLTGSAALTISGNSGANLLKGNGAANALYGQGGIDILQGGGGNDTLSDNSSERGLLDGGGGTDSMAGGSAAELFIGGAGNDSISAGSGADLIAFNRGDGLDTVIASTGADNTVSLGHGIRFADLALKKSGSDLILFTGAGEQITFQGWYNGASSRTVATLQVVTEGSGDYLAGSASAIHDNKVELFNFAALANRYDVARNASSVTLNISAWLLDASSGGSDTAAVGGSLAYLYAVDGNLAGIAAAPALALIGASGFGSSMQTLLIGNALNDGTALLY